MGAFISNVFIYSVLGTVAYGGIEKQKVLELPSGLTAVHAICERNRIDSFSWTMVLLVWLAIVSFAADHVVAVSITVHKRANEYRPLPRFWTNVGFSPPAPLPLNNTQIRAELLGNDVYVNTQLIAALPNHGIQHIRIHWLLSLIKFE